MARKRPYYWLKWSKVYHEVWDCYAVVCSEPDLLQGRTPPKGRRPCLRCRGNK